MSITQEIFEAFLKCPTMSYLYSEGAVGIQSGFPEWKRHQQEEFKQLGWRRLRSAFRTDEWYEGTLPLKALEQRRYRLILGYEVILPEVHTRLHALELTPPVQHPYIPIRFVPSEKLATTDKLLLAFDALALSRTSGKTPHLGKIIDGRQYATVTVPLTGLLGTVSSNSPYIFSSPDKPEKPIGSVRKEHDAAVRRAKIVPSFRLYDLRHTYASRAVMAGVDLPTLSCLGSA
jgi:hypothetical protein